MFVLVALVLEACGSTNPSANPSYTLGYKYSQIPSFQDEYFQSKLNTDGSPAAVARALCKQTSDMSLWGVRIGPSQSEWVRRAVSRAPGVGGVGPIPPWPWRRTPRVSAGAHSVARQAPTVRGFRPTGSVLLFVLSVAALLVAFSASRPVPGTGTGNGKATACAVQAVCLFILSWSRGPGGRCAAVQRSSGASWWEQGGVALLGELSPCLLQFEGQLSEGLPQDGRGRRRFAVARASVSSAFCSAICWNAAGVESCARAKSTSSWKPPRRHQRRT